MTKTKWSASDISKPIEINSFGGLNQIEFEDEKGEFHDFYIVATAERIVFGGVCNAGFLESGYIEREEFETLVETLAEMIDDIKVYYNVGADYVTRIVYNERM